jgi:hypothetical protein
VPAEFFSANQTDISHSTNQQNFEDLRIQQQLFEEFFKSACI